jgi:hypothetical protein
MVSKNKETISQMVLIKKILEDHKEMNNSENASK